MSGTAYGTVVLHVSPEAAAGGNLALVQNGDFIELDVEARRLQLDGRDIEVTPVEFTLLLSLARRPGSAVTRAWLVEHVLDPDKEGGERTLDVHVSRLRKKMGMHGALLATVWGVGYRLNEPGASA